MTVDTLPRATATPILLWADSLSFRQLDRLATLWRNDTFRGRTDLRDQAQTLMLEAGLLDPFAELHSDLGHALSDLAILNELLSTGTITTSSPECRLAGPGAALLCDGDTGRLLTALTDSTGALSDFR